MFEKSGLIKIFFATPAKRLWSYLQKLYVAWKEETKNDY